MSQDISWLRSLVKTRRVASRRPAAPPPQQYSSGKFQVVEKLQDEVKVLMDPAELNYSCREDRATEDEIQLGFVLEAIDFAIDVWPLKHTLMAWMRNENKGNPNMTLARFVCTSRMSLMLEITSPSQMYVTDNSSRELQSFQCFDWPSESKMSFEEFLEGAVKAVKETLRKKVHGEIARRIDGLILPVIDLRHNFKDPAVYGPYISIWLQDGEAVFSIGKEKEDMPIVRSSIQKHADLIMESVGYSGTNIDNF